ncbi:MAG TPA: carboxypeptidase-like regulatory domain-containing protein [Candidatus Saccharimonadales bacterium]|nr:carboxypeptidase-like regulatory domain-containing protein [Candidatus Saccharimonadales bacterium]
MIRAVAGLAAVVLLAGGCASEPLPPAPASSSASPVRQLRILALGADGPVAGARACAIPLAGPGRCGETGSAGSATLTLPPGAYLVRVAAPAGQREAGDRIAADLVASDASVTVRFERIREIGGTIRDAAGRSVGDARLCAHPLIASVPVCGRSGADGTYRLAVVPGLWKIEAESPPGARLLGQWARGRVSSGEADVIDARAADATAVDLVLLAGVALSGRVTAADGRPIKAAQLCTKTLAAPLPWECERTDDRGRYVALREPGRYYVWTIPPDDEPLVPEWFAGALTGVGATAVDLDADDSLDVTLRSGPSIQGKVTDTRGAPVAGALICVDTPFPSGRICRPAGLDGAYRVTTRPETYLIQVIPPPSSDAVGGFWGGGRSWLDARTVTVGGRDVTIDLVLPVGVRLSGLVRSADGVPLEGASVNLSDERGIAAATGTDEIGRYTASLAPGRYTLDVFAPFASSLQSALGRSVVITAATTLDVVLPDGAP